MITDLREPQADSSVALSASSKVEFPYLRPIKNASLKLFQAYPRKLLLKESKALPFLSIAFAKFFISPSFMCKGGSNILFGSTRGGDFTLC